MFRYETVKNKTAKAKYTNESWTGGETLSAAIGQSYNSFSPIQMVKYVSMLANGGKDVKVSIVKDIIDANRNKIDNMLISSVKESTTMKPYLEAGFHYIYICRSEKNSDDILIQVAF